jgi:hypothetical protein
MSEQRLVGGSDLDARLAKALGLGRNVRLRGSTNYVRIYSPNPYYSDGSDREEVLRGCAGKRGGEAWAAMTTGSALSRKPR